MIKSITRTFLSKYLLPKNRLGDKIYAFLIFLINHRRFPRKQKLFNDFLYNLKISVEMLNPLRIYVADKEFLKLFVKDTVGNQYNVETYAILNKPSDVDTYNFPKNCCIKPTHASGAFVIRNNNSSIDKNEIKSWFKLNHYLRSREVVYKSLTPKIIVEAVIFNYDNLIDYRFFCLNGVAKLIQVEKNNLNIGHKRYFLDKKWNKKNFSYNIPTDSNIPEKPDNLISMIEIAEKISLKFNFARVDLYSNGKDILIGEITHCPVSGSGKFIPMSGEKEASKMLLD